MKKYRISRQGIIQGIILSIIFCSIIFSTASAGKYHAANVDKTYYWTPSSGAIDSSGFIANWGSCNAQPTSYKVTVLGSTGFTCSSDKLTTTSSGDQFLAISSTAYGSDTQIIGKTGATFYLSSQRSGYTATYRFDLGYAKSGTFTSLGNVTRAVSSSSGQSYVVDLNSITGTAPAGSYIALKVSVTTSRGGRVYLGTNGGQSNSNSGRFYVNEAPSSPPTPTYNVSIKASPTSTNINAGGSYIYSVTVNNTGNTNGNYTLSVADSDTVNFVNSALGITTMQINSGGSATTTLTVTAKSGATSGAIDTTTVTVNSVENSIYTNSTQVQTTVVTPPPSSNYKIKVNTDRYSLFSPWVNKASGSSLSANFSGYALLLDGDGKPISGQSITFRIYSAAGIVKANKTAITQQNGLATVPYDTYNDFTSGTDPDYGTWKVEAYLTSNPTVISSTNMRMETGGVAINSGCKDYCHNTGTATGGKPQSPYTDNYGSTSSRAVAAHEKNQHQSFGCYLCHPGYAAVKTGLYGNTSDVHKNRTCDYCHGTWDSLINSGTGIPKMPSCYDCHPVFNSNPSSISTLANLLGGNNISVFSFNYDQKKPLAAHNGTMFSLVDSVPCLVCHGPAHNNSKPYMTGSTNSVTENEQCWACHTNRATTHKLSTNCVSCHTQNVHNISIAGGGGPDCKACHDIGGSAPKVVNFNDMNSTDAIHSRLNSGASATVNPENKKCWACHGDGTQPVSGHPTSYKTPKVCIYCHAGGTFKVDNHISGGVNISTVAYCSNCHNNSIIRFEYTANVSVSHYGTKTNLANTKDCLYCHKNIVNGNNWGGAIDPWNSLTFPHSLSTTTKEDCYSCHGDISTTNFHDIILKKPPISSMTCLDCHKLGINMTMTKIDQNVQSIAVHNGKNCTECHTNAGVNNMNTYTIAGDTPKSCILCHIGVAEHQIAGQDVKTTISCKDCHNNNGMYTANLGSNGTENAVVHYLNNVTNTATVPYGHLGPIDTSNCLICHKGQYTGNPEWGSPVNISTSIKRIHTETTNAQCDGCHKDSTISTLANVDFHNAALTAGARGSNCLSCHASAE